ncbi:MAG: hypothetical protein KC549_15690, partial [Myxococcales bacterium]|nr:hypothetical protein [Myxococcales bacterium]
DPEHGDFFGDIGVTVHDGPHTARIGGHTVWLEHGDLIDPRGLHHRLVCRVARHPWLHRAARLAPPAALWAVARAYARRGEHTYDEPLPAALLDAYLPARAREGADVVVMGHYHRAVVHTRQVDGRTVRFFGLGDWVKQRTWLRFDGDFTLLRYQDGGPPVALPEGDHAPPP